ncbi:MAG: DUF2961 domain-containing protein [Planctomycetota bacterium]|nr:MAG: DUF2961 domain-containing protein [Planctomycetota bacterium]
MALEHLSRLRRARRRRQSSYDRSGGNDDFAGIAAGAAHRLGELEGPGVIRHLWMTAIGPDPDLLRMASLRIWWDGAAQPSVDAPLSDFFGVGFGATANFASLPLHMAPQDGRGMNCFFPMPFRRGARVEVLNESDQPISHFYYYLDWEQGDAVAEDEAYFHAWFNRQNPTDGISDAGLSNRDYQLGGTNPAGAGNYVVLDCAGRGHYVGCVLSVHNLRLTEQHNWYGEGDDMIFIDGEEHPSLHGTGTEDYFNGAWCPSQAYCGPYAGITLPGGVNYGGRSSMYRFHVEDPVMFERHIRVTIEHGHANRRSDDWSSVAYWYAERPGVPQLARIPASARRPYPPDHAPGLACTE